MIEVIAALIRWLQLASNMILIGGYVFLAIAGRTSTACNANRRPGRGSCRIPGSDTSGWGAQALR